VLKEGDAAALDRDVGNRGPQICPKRLHLNRQAEGTDTTIAGVETRGLAEIRDCAAGNWTPAENLVGVDEMVRELSRKIDRNRFQLPGSGRDWSSSKVPSSGFARQSPTHVASRRRAGKAVR